jgi:hypothetical protein
MIDTSKVANRRILRFNSIDELLLEVDRLAAAEHSGRLTRLGNWTLGQALGHLATWSEFIYNGVPIKPPFFIRWIIRLQKRKFLASPLPAGVKIPNVAGGTLGTEPMSLDAGLARYQTSMHRLKVEPPLLPSPIFGKLTHEETIALALRHAELHLSFFAPA